MDYEMCRFTQLIMKYSGSWLLFCVGLSGMLVIHCADAQIQNPQSSAADEIRKQRESIAQDDTLNEASKQKTVARYDQALQQWDDMSKFQSAAKQYAEDLSTFPGEMKRIERDLILESQSLPYEPDASDDIEVLTQQLAHFKAELLIADEGLNKLGAQKSEVEKRPEQSAEKIASLNNERRDLAPILEQIPVDGEGAAKKAEVAYLTARLDAIEAELHALEMEKQSQTPRINKINAQESLLELHRERLSNAIQTIEALLNLKRIKEARERVRQTQEYQNSLQDTHPLLERIAGENVTLAQTFQRVVMDIRAVGHKRKITIEQQNKLENDYAYLRQVEMKGSAEVFGQILHFHHRRLQEIGRDKSLQRSLKQKLPDIQLKLYHHQKQLSGQGSRNTEMQRLLEGLHLTPDQTELMKRHLGVLLQEKSQLLELVVEVYGEYARALTELKGARDALTQQAEQYRHLIKKFLLWVPNAPKINANFAASLGESWSRWSQKGNWQHVLGNLLQTGHLIVLVIGVGAALLLSWLKTWAAREKKSIALLLGKVQKDQSWLTFQVLLMDIFGALPVPILLWTLAFAIHGSAIEESLLQGLHNGLYTAGWWTWVVLFWHGLSSKNGLVLNHFCWNAHMCRMIRKQVMWLSVIGSLLIIVIHISMSIDVDMDDAIDEIGRSAFIVASVLLSFLLGFWMHPRIGIVAFWYPHHPHHLLSHFRWLWFFFALLFPLSLAGMSALGYYYSALQLEYRFLQSICLLLSALVIVYCVLRWLNIARRRLTYQQALVRREAQKTARLHASDVTSGAETDIIELPELPLEQTDARARSLLRITFSAALLTGLWFIWMDIIPAFRVLDDIVLWTQIVPDGDSQKLIPITLGRLLFAVILLFVVSILSRNLPALIEIGVLQSVGVSEGNRYAITALSRYGILLLGFIAVLHAIGIGWSQAQWLVAALGIGLGFGLQEIFANFISGLILFFERPVRVGDVVTLGKNSGVVSRIQIRATTIITWDRMELIVPNRQFITESVINWTLSDSITRITVEVGVAYGSDMRQVIEIVTREVNTNPRVLADPPPTIYFSRFDDSALMVTVWAFTKATSDRIPATHELDMSINIALREAGIIIPFPQREVHIVQTQPASDKPIAAEIIQNT